MFTSSSLRKNNINNGVYEGKVEEALVNSKLLGVCSHTHINKGETDLIRDRIAANLISSDGMGTLLGCTNTVIKVSNKHREMVYRSSDIMEYNSLMAFIYTMRMEGNSVTDVANIRDGCGTDTQLCVALENMHCDNEQLRISSNKIDDIDGMVDNADRILKEKHLSYKIFIEYETDSKENGNIDTTEIVCKAFRNGFGISEKYIVNGEDGSKYIIIRSSNKACVICDKTIIFNVITTNADYSKDKDLYKQLIHEINKEIYVSQSLKELKVCRVTASSEIINI